MALALSSWLDVPRRLASIPNGLAALVCAALALPGLGALARGYPDWLEHEGLDALASRTLERMRVEALPAIAPPLVAGDRPQTFYVHAAPGARVSVRFAREARALAAEELGEGLYRVHYDPRRDGVLAQAGPFEAELGVNGKVSRRALLATRPLAHPRWLTRSPAGLLAATVSEETDELITISRRGLERRMPVGDGPIDCVFLDEQRVAVSHADGELWVLDVSRGERVRRVPLAGSLARMALDGAREFLAISAAPERGLLVLSTRDLTVSARAELDQPADWLAFAESASTLVVSTRADASLRALEREGGTLRELTRLPLGRPAVTLARVREGAELLLAVTDYRPDGSPQLGNHFVQDQILRVATSPLRVLSSWPTARRSARQLSPGSVDRGLSPMGIAEARGGMLLTFAGSEELWRLASEGAMPELWDVGEHGAYAPHSSVELADGTLIVSSPSAGALLLMAPGKPALPVRLAPDDAYLATHDHAALAYRLGERAFYEATQSGISCQSCHLHADSDQRAHNLGTHGLLPTLSVRGLAGTAPYLRDGSFARIRELDHVSRTLYRGYRRKLPGRAQTLEAYVEALPRLPVRAEPDLALVRAGTREFVRAGCVSCHAFPAFTGLGQQLAKSLFPRHTRHAADDVLDTPSLLSIASSPPYLSDGRARSLSELLGVHNQADRHGHTRDLSVARRRALLAFLESL